MVTAPPPRAEVRCKNLLRKGRFAGMQCRDLLALIDPTAHVESGVWVVCHRCGGLFDLGILAKDAKVIT